MMRASGSRTSVGNRRMAGSLNRLNRKDCTASNRSGPPRFISTTAIRVTLGTHWFGQETSECLHVFRRCFRQHPVTEIEDVRSRAEALAEFPHRFLERRPSADQQDRIEIALTRPVRLQGAMRIAKRHRRINADPVDPGLAKIALMKHASATRKTDDRTIGK